MARGSSFTKRSDQSVGDCRENWLNVEYLELLSGLVGGAGGGGGTRGWGSVGGLRGDKGGRGSWDGCRYGYVSSE